MKMPCLGCKTYYINREETTLCNHCLAEIALSFGKEGEFELYESQKHLDETVDISSRIV